jgi:acetylornithine deacetylase/succinyl-diaminopimelate desuccinylase-like protein
MYRKILLLFFVPVAAIYLCSTTASCQSADNFKALTAEQKLARDIFRELIEINTTVNYGSARAAEALAKRLRIAGFPDSDIQIIGPGQMHQNLVVRYRGTGKHPPILFIGHLDVVEAHRQDWTMDPFQFIEQDGYFYGRGTTDMKCEDADLVANFIRLKQEGFLPNRDIIMALTEDEEGGDYNGITWLLANHRKLIDAEYCINPDGGGGTLKNGQHTTLEVQTSEKVYLSFRLEVKNKGGHSSLPVRENAIYRLAAGLVRLSQFNFPIRLNETTRTFFERSALRETGQVKSDMLAILTTPPDTAAARRLAEYSAYYNAIIRTTSVATLLSAGHAENALPQSARAIVNCRMLPDDNPDNVLAGLQQAVADSQITITRLNQPFLSPLSPLRKDVMDAVESQIRVMWPEVIVTPVMSTGATDGKYLRRAGIPVYGISGMFGDPDDIRAHGQDERILTSEFYSGVEFMYGLMKSLTLDH